MSVIVRKDYKDKSQLSIDLLNIIKVYSIKPSELIDIYFGLKSLATEADDILFLKTLVFDGGDAANYPGGITVVGEKILVPFDGANDWDNLVAGTEYLICLAIRREEPGWFEEVRFNNSGCIDEQAKIKILQDKVRR